MSDLKEVLQGKGLLKFAGVLPLCLLAAAASSAQQTAAPPCSPAATQALNSKSLPAQSKPFGGVIKRDARESKPCWDPRIVPPEGAPNVLLIMTDDAGFGVSSTFGGVIPTPAFDLIAKNGLRYTNFNSTALCSPTRAALITGRNHHSVGFGVVSEQATGYPGYNSIIPKDKATIGTILKENGYSTAWFGKDHNTPAFAASRLDRLISGRWAWALITSMDSLVATPINGSRTSSATLRKSIPMWDTLVGI
ncbi:MAG: sulfatase-like hydrolase/transferase [Candidatus Acidiferrum sp.]